MTADDILEAARKRLAELEAELAKVKPLEEEAAKLRKMLSGGCRQLQAQELEGLLKRGVIYQEQAPQTWTTQMALPYEVYRPRRVSDT